MKVDFVLLRNAFKQFTSKFFKDFLGIVLIPEVPVPVFIQVESETLVLTLLDERG
jgi:hypothetical protein